MDNLTLAELEARFQSALAALPEAIRGSKPGCGLILGSGWSGAMDNFEEIVSVGFGAIPGLNASTVPGHAGELALYTHAERTVLAFRGRRHWYEGEGWLPVTLPLEIMRRLGVPKVLLTNAVGGINPQFSPGDFMLVRDHLSLHGLNPLQGPVLPGWGTRFPDQSSVYSGAFAQAARACAARIGVRLHEGSYVFTGGPCFETPAEIKAYGLLGGDVVGMSTVPEAIVANAMGMEVAALSCVSNMAAGMGGDVLSHADVLETMSRATPLMHKFLIEVLDYW